MYLPWVVCYYVTMLEILQDAKFEYQQDHLNQRYNMVEKDAQSNK